MLTRYLTASPVRTGLLAICLPLVLALPAGAQAATDLYISGAGNGHGIGMSQYGADGDALHGWSYQHILGHYYQGTGLRTIDPTRTVRVLLGTGAYGSPSFSGAASAVAPRGTNQPVPLSAGQTYSVKAVAGGQVALYDSSGHQLASVRPPLVVSGPGPVEFQGHGQYRGALEFRWSAGPRVQTVNALGLDDYVRGVVSAEMPASWPTQALEAQAVAARTYAITTSVAGNGYGLYSDTRSQMYRGVAAETSNTDAAVAATQGQVVTLKGTPVATYFFASSGGHTESIQDAWPGSTADSWLRGVEDPYDDAGGNPYYRWSVRVTLASAAADLGSLVKRSLQGIKVTHIGASPRVMQASVVGSGGTTTVTGAQLQGIFGLMSTWMSFSTISTTAPRSSIRYARMATFGYPSADSLVLVGSVSPAPGAGGRLTVQRLYGGGWQTVLRSVPVTRRGTYRMRLRSSGRYRVVYRGMSGPAVSVG